MSGVEIDRSPERTGAAISIVATFLAVAILGPGIVLGFSVPGAILLGLGAATGSRSAVNYGAFCLFAGIAVAGINGGPPEQLVPCTLLTIVAWDAGGYAITLGHQIGRVAETWRASIVHSSLTVGVGAAGAIMAYSAYSVLSGSQPMVVLTFLFVGVVLLVAALR